MQKYALSHQTIFLKGVQMSKLSKMSKLLIVLSVMFLAMCTDGFRLELFITQMGWSEIPICFFPIAVAYWVGVFVGWRDFNTQTDTPST